MVGHLDLLGKFSPMSSWTVHTVSKISYFSWLKHLNTLYWIWKLQKYLIFFLEKGFCSKYGSFRLFLSTIFLSNWLMCKPPQKPIISNLIQSPDWSVQRLQTGWLNNIHKLPSLHKEHLFTILVFEGFDFRVEHFTMMLPRW